MDLSSNQSEQLFITFKFNGHWVQLKTTERRKYDGGRQKTIKFHKDSINFEILKNEVVTICPWLKGHYFELFYHVCGTSPKEYMCFESNSEVMEMLAQYNDSGRIEIVVVTKEAREVPTYPQSQDRGNGCDILDHCRPSSEYIYNDILDVVPHQGLVLGAQFCDVQSFKQMLRTHSIINNFGIKLQASNRTRVVAVCQHRGCPWRVRASLCKDGNSFQVRKLESTHLCPGVNRAGNKQATSSWVAREIAEVVRKDPDIPPKQINMTLENMYGLSLPYMKLWRSREEARDTIFGSIDDSYRLIPALQAELMNRNPGSLITYTCSQHDHSFQRFFVSFKVSIDGFLVGCRHLIGLDACHLKSKYLGVLLSANSLDGNNGLFTLAFAVAESESKKSWKWFLENLAVAIGMNLEHLSFISDMEKSLAESIKLVFPDAEHRVCLRHMWKNLKKKFCRSGSEKVGSLVWSSANAFTRLEFDAHMSELCKISPQVYSYLLSLPYKWARSDFLPQIKNHYNTNNMSESFNSWIGDARNKSVVDLVDTLRGKLMEQRAERKINSLAWRGELVPYAEDYIRDITTRKDQFIIRQSTVNKAEIEGREDRHEVDLDKKECTCKVWEAMGLPCIHAAVFIGSKDHPLWHTYVDECYHIIRYQMAYEGPISTLPEKGRWCDVDCGVPVGVPNTLRPRGRPKKRRIKIFLEDNSKRSKSVHQCGRCAQWGHHKTSCKNPLTKESSEEPALYINTDISSQHSANMGFRAKLPIRREGKE